MGNEKLLKAGPVIMLISAIVAGVSAVFMARTAKKSYKLLKRRTSRNGKK